MNRTDPGGANRGIARLWAAYRVRRWHANPMMAHLPQTNADHVGGCLALLLALHPTASADLVRAAVFHDLGERWVGDLPFDFKQAEPEAAAQHAGAEAAAVVKALGFDPTEVLTPTDRAWLKLVDRMDPYLFTAMYRRDELDRNGWPKALQEILALADRLGVRAPVWETMSSAREGLFA